MAQGSATAFFALGAKAADDSERPRCRQEQFEAKAMTSLNNFHTPNGNGTPAKATPRCPRRVVLLRDGEDSEVDQILQEYQHTEVSGNRLHADVQRLAAEHPGLYVAAEWLGPLGWTRFLWCRREAKTES